MAESTSQQSFFGNTGMHYMAHQTTTSFDETPEDLFHDQHLELQERMQNPIAFHSKMMGDVMYYHQALQKPDSKQLANAVIKEVNVGTCQAREGPKGCTSCTLCMVHATQAKSHHQ
jgi:hypothetical protein